MPLLMLQHKILAIYTICAHLEVDFYHGRNLSTFGIQSCLQAFFVTPKKQSS